MRHPPQAPCAHRPAGTLYLPYCQSRWRAFRVDTHQNRGLEKHRSALPVTPIGGTNLLDSPTGFWPEYGDMAVRKMTFTLPIDLVDQFTKRVPSRDRSGFLAQALAEKLAQRETRLARACQIANSYSEVQEIEEEFGSIPSEISESWTGPTPARRHLAGPPRSNARIRN